MPQFEKIQIDPQDPSRKIVIEKLRGGRPPKIMRPKRGPGSYLRRKEKDWSRYTTAHRVIDSFLTATPQE